MKQLTLSEIYQLLGEQDVQSVRITIYDKPQIVNEIEKYIKELTSKQLLKSVNYYNQSIEQARIFLEKVNSLRTVNFDDSKSLKKDVVKIKELVELSDEKQKRRLSNTLDKIISLIKVEFYINQYYRSQFAVVCDEVTETSGMLENYGLKTRFKLFLNTMKNYEILVDKAFKQSEGNIIPRIKRKNYFTEIVEPKGAKELRLKQELLCLAEDIRNNEADKILGKIPKEEYKENILRFIKDLQKFDQKMFYQKDYLKRNFIAETHSKLAVVVNNRPPRKLI